MITLSNREQGWRERRFATYTEDEIAQCELYNLKKCTKCKVLYPATDYKKRRSQCNGCLSTINKESYTKNPNYKLSTVANKNRKRIECRTKLCEFLVGKECKDCHTNDPMVLEFDHFKDKTGNIANLAATGNWPLVEAEIAKCEIRCANCHKKKTHKENNTIKHQFFNK